MSFLLWDENNKPSGWAVAPGAESGGDGDWFDFESAIFAPTEGGFRDGGGQFRAGWDYCSCGALIPRRAGLCERCGTLPDASPGSRTERRQLRHVAEAISILQGDREALLQAREARCRRHEERIRQVEAAQKLAGSVVWWLLAMAGSVLAITLMAVREWAR